MLREQLCNYCVHGNVCKHKDNLQKISTFLADTPLRLKVNCDEYESISKKYQEGE